MRRPIQTPRYTEIDFIKGFSALAVILIHVLDKYRSIEYVHVFWIILHFAVATFVVASGFLQQMKPLIISETENARGWLLRRILRLVKPYYIYVVIHGLLILLLPTIFNRVDIEFTPQFFFDTVLLIGGFSQNWIPRLFVLMATCYVIFEMIRQKMKKPVSFVLVPFILSLLLSIIFIFDPFNLSSTAIKYLQTLTWISLFFFGMLFYQHFKEKHYIILTWGLSGALTLMLYLLLKFTGEPTSIFSHEYPPTLYFISYGIFLSLTLYTIASKLISIKSISRPFADLFSFLSRHSYTIFFAHIIVMDLLKKPTGFWLTDYLIIMPTTVLSVYLGEKIINHFKKPWIV